MKKDGPQQMTRERVSEIIFSLNTNSSPLKIRGFNPEEGTCHLPTIHFAGVNSLLVSGRVVTIIRGLIPMDPMS